MTVSQDMSSASPEISIDELPIYSDNWQRLTYNTYNDFHPVFSPDGSEIAFMRFADGWNCLILMMTPDGTNQNQLTYGSVDEFPHFSNDGTRLLLIDIMMILGGILL